MLQQQGHAILKTAPARAWLLVYGIVPAMIAGPALAIDWNLREVFAPVGMPSLLKGGTPPPGALLKPVIFRIQPKQIGNISRLELTVTQKVDMDAFLLAKPNRVIIDMPEVLFQLEGKASASNNDSNPGAGLIRTFRYGSLGKGRSRIVLDLRGPARITKISTIKIASTVYRLRVDVSASRAAEFLAAAAKGRQEAIVRSRSQKEAVTGFSPVGGGKPLIVIDPGHGGIDGGAHGHAGESEKDIVLLFSTLLAKKIEKTGSYKVLLTRKDDIFVPLSERVAIARRAKARLFISVHADSLSEKWVRGATVYTISDRASDGHAARLAEKENKADEKAGLEQPADTAQISDILYDLTRRETRAFSHVFAGSLIREWGKFGELNKNPHRSGRFHVLKAPDVPSVLLELGYLSSKQDSVLLSTPEWREKATTRVTEAIDRFFKSRKGQGLAVGGIPAARLVNTASDKPNDQQ